MKKLTLVLLLAAGIAACSNGDTDTAENRSHVHGFESFQRNLIGDGSTGALAGLVHGWEMRNWHLAAKYLDGKKDSNLVYLDTLLYNKYLYGFEAGNIEINNPNNHIFKNCVWTVVTPEDTTTVVTDLNLFNRNPAKNEWVVYRNDLEKVVSELK